MKTDIELIKDSIKTIMNTGIGSRVMRPEFGASVHEMIFENADPPSSVISMFRSRIKHTLQREEPRVSITEIGLEVKTGPNEIRYINVTIFFDYAGAEDSTNIQLGMST